MIHGKKKHTGAICFWVGSETLQSVMITWYGAIAIGQMMPLSS